MKLNEKISKYIISNSLKIKINSNEIKKNDIFIALKGKKYHGNKFIKAAFNAGAKFCITDKKYIQPTVKEKILQVENIFTYLEALSIQKRLLFSGIVIGITGSAGKTSLKEYLSFYLKKKYNISKSIKSYNNYLGVMISILNMDINSKFAIFELGTNNFFEIRKLTQLVKPSQIFITNIHSTHLENFKNKKNIAKEKSDIFVKKFNPNAETVYFQMISNEEKLINNFANKQKLKKIIKIGKPELNCFINNIKIQKLKYEINLKILNKSFSFIIDSYEESHIKNLIFVLAFFITNKIDTNIILQNKMKTIQIDGRGSIHKGFLGNNSIYLIDQSYNANPETMIQSIKNFSNNKKKGYQKILLLGDMNELGLNKLNFHYQVLKETNQHLFDKVILSGKLFKKALKISPNFKSKYIFISTAKGIMSYLRNNLHKKAMLMAKCSNATEVNKFVKLLKIKMKDKIV